jgi:putative flippase GtrA
MINQIRKLLKSLFWFGLVGGAAMIVHFYTVVAIFVPLNIHPLIANTLGFLIAFVVSYLGHAHLTFRNPSKPNNTNLKSMYRFLSVAILGFVINQMIFFILLQHTQLGIDTSLAITLLFVSGVTYLLSRFWAFKTAIHD